MSSSKHHFNLAASEARFEAWWTGGRLDRPPVSLWVEHAHAPAGPRSHHHSLHDRWMDVGFQVASALHRLEHNPCYGDTLPSWFPNVGPDLVSTLFGAELIFGDNTSWCQHTVHETADWDRFAATKPDFNNPYWRAIEDMITLAAERFGGRFIIAMPDLHGSFDILSGVRGPENLCLDIYDEPERVRAASLQASRVYVEAFRRLHQRLTSLDQPSTTWCNYLHSGPAYVPSCDFWCLVSREIGQDLIRPTIELEMSPLERSIFHLDGPQALHHLDLVLDLPKLNAVQWVFGAGHGPAQRWLHIYRQIRAAGKAIQVIAEDAEDALTVLEEIGPEGMWITVSQPFADPGHAHDFLDAVHAACK